MYIALALVFLYGIGQLIYSGYYFSRAREISKTVHTGKFDLGDSSLPAMKVFVGGDSIAAGAGASSFETSVTGQLARHLAKTHHVILLNEAASGVQMADMLKRPVPKEKQDIAILIVSSNDVFRLTNLEKFADATKEVLACYTAVSHKLIIVGPARISAAPALPFLVRLLYEHRIPQYASIIAREAARYPNAIHLVPHAPSKGTFASDKFHPNDAGYTVWFDAIKNFL